MRKGNVKLGEIYVVKVSGKLAPVKLLRESVHGGWIGRNERTGREVRIKSAGRLRGKLDDLSRDAEAGLGTVWVAPKKGASLQELREAFGYLPRDLFERHPLTVTNLALTGASIKPYDHLRLEDLWRFLP